MKRLTPLLILWAVMTAVTALFTLFTPTVQADEVGGVIDTNTTWTLAGSPYIITDTVIITGGVTLTVAAGVTVQAQPGTGVVVNGSLLALGTPTQPITFTSTGETGPGDWDGITVASTGRVSLTHSAVSYAVSGLNLPGGNGQPVALANASLRQNQMPLTVAPDALHQLQMANVTFSQNSNNRILLRTTATNYALADNVTLTSQPGLEGYQISDDYYQFLVPQSISLTLEAGVSLFLPGGIDIEGHIQANGTVSENVIFTGVDSTSPSWGGIGVWNSGSARLENTVIQHSAWGVSISGSSNQPIEFIDTTIKENEYTVSIEPRALHRLQMDHGTFTNNTFNRIHILDDYSNTLTDDVTLTSQPGLEGYEVSPDIFGGSNLIIPQGITLTMVAGATLFMPENFYLWVYGHLEANGTPNEDVTFTDIDNSGNVPWNIIAVSGSARLENTVIQYSCNGISAAGSSSRPVELIDVIIRDNEFPAYADVGSLHKLYMDNVTFLNNANNRVIISTCCSDTLTANVMLTSQPGLEGYEVGDPFGTNNLFVPQNITLTLEADTILMLRENTSLVVQGHLQANGTISENVIFTAADSSSPWNGIDIGISGTVRLENAVAQNADFALAIYDESNQQVELANTTFMDNNIPIYVQVEALHRLGMNNVTFNNNARDRVVIFDYYSSGLTDHVTLTPQPGLAGYEYDDFWSGRGLVVPQGVSLTLAAGTTFFMPEDRDLQVAGRLLGQGTAVSPITLTSALDSAPGQWAGIVVADGDVWLTHTDLRFAQTGISMTTPGSRVVISRSQVLSSSQAGMVVADGVLDVACTAVAQHGAAGVFVGGQASANPQATLYSSQIWGNGQAGITHTHGSPVRAGWNWWGHPSGPGGNGPGSGDAVYGDVLYEPWLAEPACLPSPPGGRIFLPVMRKP